MSTYAASVDGTLYGFQHSPLGILHGNVRFLRRTAQRRRGVRLHEWCATTNTWRAVQWPAHLWWTRFLLTAHAVLLGTRHECLGHFRNTARLQRWWLEHTAPEDRTAFFRNPDIRALCRSLRQSGLSWAVGYHGLAHSLLRIRQMLRRSHPQVMRPCSPDDGSLGYTREYQCQAVTRLLEDWTATSDVSHAFDVLPFADALLERYGCRLSEVLSSFPHRCTPFLPTSAPPSVDPALHHAVVRRYRELACTVLDYDNQRFITPGALESLWRDFAASLCSLRQHSHVVLLDGAVPVRRRVHQALRDAMVTCWLADCSATVTNLQEEVGVQADTANFFVRAGRHYHGGASQDVVLVDGMQRLGLRSQADLLRRLLSEPFPKRKWFVPIPASAPGDSGR